MKKILTIVVCSFFFLNLANVGYSNVLHTNIEGGKLLQIFRDISERYNVHFTYDREIVENVEIKVYDPDNYVDVEDALSNVLKETKLKYIMLEMKYVIIYQDDAAGMKSLEEMVDVLQKIIQQKKGKRLVSALDKLKSTTDLSDIHLEKFRMVLNVSGTVTDQTGEPLIGVNIQVKGTNQGTATDFDGKFGLEEVNENANLVFSYIGYQTREVEINGLSNIDVVMVEDLQTLDEVVVVGYGTQKKSDLTGVVSSVSKKSFENQSINSLEQGLQGRVPGLVVTQGSSAPGSGMSIRIRGGNSILGGSEPLYVIDGLPIASNQFKPSGINGNIATNPLASIDPSNIESIEVLKDASATAIYGSRGANGVVLITTKRGKTGAPSLTFDGFYGVQTIAKKLEMMDSQEMYEFQKAWAANNDISFDSPVPNYNTDWQDLIYTTAPTQNYNLTASGGTEKVKYSISGGYLNQDGIIETSGFNRFTFHTNIDMQANDFLSWGGNLMATRSIWDQTSSEGGLYQGAGIVSTALQVFPNVPAYNSDGSYALQTQPDFDYPAGARPLDNPLALLKENSDQTVGVRVLGNTFINFYLLNGLSFKMSAGADIDNRARDVYLGRNTVLGGQANGSAKVSNVERTTWLNENILTYIKSFSEHSFNIIGGFTVQNDVERIRNTGITGFSTDITKTNDLSAGTVLQTPFSNKIESYLLSYLGRINYSYNNKYLLSLTARRDGSSRFSENNKWALFPAIALGWKLSEEDFIRNSEWFSNLKIRASWGVTGNQELGVYRSLSRLSVANYNFNNSVVPGYRITSVSNPNLKWETTKQINLGVDIGLLEDRFTLTADIYDKTTEDLLLNINLPTTSGFRTSTQNAGSLANKGFELAIKGAILASALSWNAGFNIAFNRNKVLKLNNGNDIFYGTTELSNNVLIREGQPVGVFYGYKTDGIFNDQSELEGNPHDNQADLGSVKIVDVNGDGLINTLDLTVIGNPQPDFTYGFNSQISFKKFSLDFFIQGVQNADIWNVNNQELTSAMAVTNKLKSRRDFWTPENINAKFPIPGDVSPFSNTDFSVVEDGTYIRLRQLTLSYSMPIDVNKGFKNIKFYLTGQNLFTITDYTGFNPDVNVESGSTVYSGIDLGAYPLAKTFLLGASISF